MAREPLHPQQFLVSLPRTPAVFTTTSAWQELEAGKTGLGYLGAFDSKESKSPTTEKLLWDTRSHPCQRSPPRTARGKQASQGPRWRTPIPSPEPRQKQPLTLAGAKDSSSRLLDSNIYPISHLPSPPPPPPPPKKFHMPENYKAQRDPVSSLRSQHQEPCLSPSPF